MSHACSRGFERRAITEIPVAAHDRAVGGVGEGDRQRGPAGCRCGAEDRNRSRLHGVEVNAGGRAFRACGREPRRVVSGEVVVHGRSHGHRRDLRTENSVTRRAVSVGTIVIHRDRRDGRSPGGHRDGDLVEVNTVVEIAASSARELEPHLQPRDKFAARQVVMEFLPGVAGPRELAQARHVAAARVELERPSVRPVKRLGLDVELHIARRAGGVDAIGRCEHGARERVEGWAAFELHAAGIPGAVIGCRALLEVASGHRPGIDRPVACPWLDGRGSHRFYERGGCRGITGAEGVGKRRAADPSAVGHLALDPDRIGGGRRGGRLDGGRD